MTDLQIAIAERFKSVSFGLQTGQRNFAMNMEALARMNPTAKLSARQERYLYIVAKRFISQMPEELRFKIQALAAAHENVVPSEPNAQAVSLAKELCEHLDKVRFSLDREKALQASMYGYLLPDFPTIEREVSLGDGDIIDFVVDNVGIEVKIKGAKRAIFRQLERYAAHDRIQALVFSTNVAMGMPQDVGGKPIFLHNLGKAWL
jgi:hypothetical protein